MSCLSCDYQTWALFACLLIVVLLFYLFFWYAYRGEVPTQQKVKRKWTLKEKKIICAWISESFGTPDYDGFIGRTSIPEDMMVTYRKIYPKSWGDAA